MNHNFMLHIDWNDTAPPNLPTNVGPFQTHVEAQKWARLSVPNGSWEVWPLAYPYHRAADLAPTPNTTRSNLGEPEVQAPVDDPSRSGGHITPMSDPYRAADQGEPDVAPPICRKCEQVMT